MPYTIVPVMSPKELEIFLHVPWKIYIQNGKKDPNWVPPFLDDYRSILNPKKNPFFEHAKVQNFILMDEQKSAVGRISGIIDDLHNQVHNEKTGWFGFFECPDDFQAANLLFKTVETWVKEQGMQILRGPASPSLNDEVAFLLEGYDSPPKITMTYNPPYYHQLAEKNGLTKIKDLYAWYLKASTEIPERISRIAAYVMKKENITVRSLDMKHFDRDTAYLKDIYNKAWEKNWGFVPMTDKEFEYAAKKFKPIAWPDFIQFAEVNGKPIACNIVLPDVNQALIHMNGELNLSGLIKFLWYSRKINDTRMIAMGVLPEYRKKGVDAIMYLEALKTGKKRNVLGGELSWTLEDNHLINDGIKAMGGTIYKKYRIYQKLI